MMTSKLNTKISTFRSALLVAALAFAPLTASLHAQMAERVQVNVPFAFQNGSEVLPAGTYTLMRSSNILTIHGHDNGGLAIVHTEGGSVAGSGIGKVVFQRYGDKYFLREVWSSGESSHTVCLQTTAEKKAMLAQLQVVGNSMNTLIQIAVLRPIR